MPGGSERHGDDQSNHRPARAAPPEVTIEHPQLLDRVPAIIYVAEVGDAGRWHYVSPQIQAILGYSPEEWCADPTLWAQRLHPEDRERVLRSEASSRVASQQQGASEYRMRHRDGHVVWIRDDALLVREGDDSVRWHGVLSDITQGKQAEAELERRAAQQSAVARLGEHALEGAATDALMREAVNCAADILGVEMAAVLELQGEEGCFVLRSGVGWPDARDPNVRFPVGNASHAGYTVLTGAPVIVTDWAKEQRFGRSPA